MEERVSSEANSRRSPEELGKGEGGRRKEEEEEKENSGSRNCWWQENAGS